VNDVKEIAEIKNWVESFVVEMNLCPFAKRELINNRVRFVASNSSTREELLGALQDELVQLETDSGTETTILVHANVLQDFQDYNDFLDVADQLLIEMNFEGVYQIASFHPDYQFAGTTPDAPENYTNRSPYPMLHLLREASLERAVAAYSDVDEIPVRNIELMNRMGQAKLSEMFNKVKNSEA